MGAQALYPKVRQIWISKEDTKVIAVSLPTGDMHGWGVAGWNITRELRNLTEVVEVGKYSDRIVDCPPCFHAIRGPDFLPMNPNVFSKTRNVGYCFIEHNSIAKQYIGNAKRYFDHVCAGSTWTTNKLRDMGIEVPVSTLLQGVDPDIFKPDPSVKPPDDKFVIFSGGKWEYRKGQDVVLAAFKILSQKYKDMHLVAQWHNPWPETMRSMSESKLIKVASFQNYDPSVIIRTTLALNGIREDRVTLLSPIPNSEMAPYYQRCHVGLALSRCESGTNLPAMELAACGVPLIMVGGTGHTDIYKGAYGTCSSKEYGDDGWREPSVDDAIWWIETVYQLYNAAATAGKVASYYIRSNFTWAKTASEIMKVMEVAL